MVGRLAARRRLTFTLAGGAAAHAASTPQKARVAVTAEPIAAFSPSAPEQRRFGKLEFVG